MIGPGNEWIQLPPEFKRWSHWVHLGTAPAKAPEDGGLYRIRTSGASEIAYLGSTGRARVQLPARFRALNGVDGAVMPYRSPYAAAPVLWALRDASGAPLQVSWSVVGDPARCEALWFAAMALHRAAHGSSPAANFGRMIPGYRSSSARSCELLHRGGQSRGRRSLALDRTHDLGRPPVGSLTADPTTSDWCGIAWSPWDGPAVMADGFAIMRARRGSDAALLALAAGKANTLGRRIRKQFGARV